MTLLFIGVGVLILMFGLVVFVGAPYLPTMTPQIEAAFDLLGLHSGNTLLELGCGDGKVLLLAASKGYKAVGIELNPILVLIAWARTRRYRETVQVRWGNFWHMTWPTSDGVFVFLINKFMPKLDKRMEKRGGKLVSVAFSVPGRVPNAEKSGVFLYDYHLRSS